MFQVIIGLGTGVALASIYWKRHMDSALHQRDMSLTSNDLIYNTMTHEGKLEYEAARKKTQEKYPQLF